MFRVSSESTSELNPSRHASDRTTLVSGPHSTHSIISSQRARRKKLAARLTFYPRSGRESRGAFTSTYGPATPPKKTSTGDAPGRNRTSDRWIRNPLLYPSELRALNTGAWCVVRSAWEAVKRTTHHHPRTVCRVGAAGFEPAASWSQTRRATGLRHTPNNETRRRVDAKTRRQNLQEHLQKATWNGAVRPQ